MSLYTQHRKWRFEPGPGFSVAAGPAGLNISTYELIGDGTEQLNMVFAGAGPGVGVRCNFRGEAVDEAVSVNPGILPSLGASTPIVFSGPTRSGRDFNGMGYVLDISVGTPLGFGTGVQLLLFNIAVSPFALVHAAELAWQYYIGEIRSLEQLRRVAPAFALTANGLVMGTGISAGATAYHGYWRVTEPTAPVPSYLPPSYRTTSYHP